MCEARDHAGSDRIDGSRNYDRNRARHLLEDRDDAAADGDDDIRFALQETRGVAAHQLHVVGCPALIELDFAALEPAQPVKLLLEAPHPCLHIRVARGKGHQDSHPPQLVAGLLRARRERPSSRTADKRDEVAASYPAHSRASGNPDATVRGSGSPLSRGRTEFGSPPPHSITSLARAMNTSDKETPSDAAVFRLTAM